MLKTYQFKTQCKGDIHSSETANIILPGLMTEYRWTPLRVQNRIQVQIIHGCWLKQLVSPSLNTTSLVHVSATFNSDTVWASDEGFKIALCVAPQTWYLDSIQIWRVIRWPIGHCSFSSICVHFSWRHCWETRAMCAEPHASCWIWQQSVALFNELWEQKLINNFNYCLQQHQH